MFTYHSQNIVFKIEIPFSMVHMTRIFEKPLPKTKKTASCMLVYKSWLSLAVIFRLFLFLEQLEQNIVDYSQLFLKDLMFCLISKT